MLSYCKFLLYTFCDMVNSVFYQHESCTTVYYKKNPLLNYVNVTTCDIGSYMPAMLVSLCNFPDYERSQLNHFV